jgi:flavin-dependent dehydrogenase
MGVLPRATDVFVIGGGPAGLAAAVAARRRGFAVTLADCSRPPIDKACGEGVMPDGIASALALGIDLSAAGGQPFLGIRFSEGGASVEARFPNGFGLGLRRTALHHLMVNCAAEAGVHLAWGARISGLHPEGVLADGHPVRARWIIGADGGQSSVRRWAGLDACRRDSRRYGFRRHYRVAPWSEFMEIHWGDGCQIYITPVSASEVCVVLISRDRRLRLDETLPQFPEVARHLAAADPSTVERGGVSATRTLKSVWRGRVALCGDASGSVDAISGEGLCLLFQQAASLADALAAGDLRLYQAAHRRIARRPAFMAELMLLMGSSRRLHSRAIRAMASQPGLFSQMLAMHVGELSPIAFATNGLALGWQMLTI